MSKTIDRVSTDPEGVADADGGSVRLAVGALPRWQAVVANAIAMTRLPTFRNAGVGIRIAMGRC